MKILYINSVVDYGSTGNLVRELASSEKNKGNDVLICYGRFYKEKAQDSFFFGSKFQSMIHVVTTRLLGRHGLHSTIATRKLLKKIVEFNPDIIHLHNLHGYYLNVPMLFDYISSKGTKVLWTLHDCWSFSGSSAHFDYYGCREWQDGCVVCNNTSTYPESIGLKRQKKNFNWKKRKFTQIEGHRMIIITPSNWLRDLTKKTFLKKYEIATIYNGIDLDRYSIKNEKEKSSRIKLLGVANDWTKLKGFDDFILLRQKLDPDKYQITLVGLTDKQLSKIPEGIIGIKRTSNFEELVRLYQDSDIYLNLSYEETMGLTTVEALACGTPSIVYDATAVPEVVSEDTGVIVKAGNIDRLVEVIQTLDWTKYSKENFTNRVKDFSLSKMNINYERKVRSLYEEN